jgi:hypothetical protein
MVLNNRWLKCRRCNERCGWTYERSSGAWDAEAPMACANPASGVREGALRPGAPALMGIPNAQLEPPPSFAVCPPLCEASGVVRFALACVWNTLPAIGRSACCPFPTNCRQPQIFSASSDSLDCVAMYDASDHVDSRHAVPMEHGACLITTIFRLGAKGTRAPRELRDRHT